MKIELAKELTNCMTEKLQDTHHNGNKCYICPCREDCDELFVLIKRRWLPVKSEDYIDNDLATFKEAKKNE